jgi:hypothetical protein
MESSLTTCSRSFSDSKAYGVDDLTVEMTAAEGMAMD